MTYPIRYLNVRRRSGFASSLREVISQLETIGKRMREQGLIEEARSVTTTVDDLRWQEETLASPEEEMNEPRRRLGSTPRSYRDPRLTGA